MSEDHPTKRTCKLKPELVEKVFDINSGGVVVKVGGDPNNPVFSKNVNFSEIDRILCKNYRRFRI